MKSTFKGIEQEEGGNSLDGYDIFSTLHPAVSSSQPHHYTQQLVLSQRTPIQPRLQQQVGLLMDQATCYNVEISASESRSFSIAPQDEHRPWSPNPSSLETECYPQLEQQQREHLAELHRREIMLHQQLQLQLDRAMLYAQTFQNSRPVMEPIPSAESSSSSSPLLLSSFNQTPADLAMPSPELQLGVSSHSLDQYLAQLQTDMQSTACTSTNDQDPQIMLSSLSLSSLSNESSLPLLPLDSSRELFDILPAGQCSLLNANQVSPTGSTPLGSHSKAVKRRRRLRPVHKVKKIKPTSFACTAPGCDKVFSRAYNLTSHMKSHSAERPFQCSVCPLAFARRHDKDRHERLHTGEKPYLCEKCGCGFMRNDALLRHQLRCPQ